MKILINATFVVFKYVINAIKINNYFINFKIHVAIRILLTLKDIVMFIHY